MCIPNFLCICLPKSKAPDIEIDIIETPKSIELKKNHFSTMNIKIDGKARSILTGKK